MTREEFRQKYGPTEDLTFRAAEFALDLRDLVLSECAKAREEQRAVDIGAVLAPAREKDPDLEQDHPEEVHAARVRRAALTTTPLADRIAELERERIEARGCIAEWKARAEKAEAELAELRDWPCEGVGCEVTLGALESDPGGPGGGTWFCASCWNKALPAARRHGAEAQREACAKAVDLSPEDEADFKRLAEEIGAITDRSTLDDILVTIRATPLVTDKEPKR